MSFKLKIFIIYLTALSLHNESKSQALKNAAKDAFIITRMANKIHIREKELDSNFSKDFRILFLKNIDPEKIFLTKNDITDLDPLLATLHVQIQLQQTNFLQEFIAIFKRRLLFVDTEVNNIKKEKLNFSNKEVYTIKEDTNYCISELSLKQKINKLVKVNIANNIVDELLEQGVNVLNKKTIDSLEPIHQKRICEIYSRDIQKKINYPGGVEQFLCNEYCKTIALCYDPHTNYFTNTDKENFESHLGKKNFIFGFSLAQKNDFVVINKLVPGSAAFKSGQINKDDKITAIQWEGQQAVDVSTASVIEISELLSLSNHSKLTLYLTKPDGKQIQVVLNKEANKSNEDEEKVQSFILKGTKTVGYIALPSFYQDWENEENLNGCSNDVAKEIIKLKKENIEGLIIDVRYNGGGSLQEAVELAGIFIDAGPVAQIKKKSQKVITLKDVNRGTIYDGPLTILVNGFSASASELFAGVLQDYNRAVIIGSPTFGKATGQIIIPLDTTINIDGYSKNINNETNLKITNIQLYQVSGKTAQFAGVIPDIYLPDITEIYNTRESNEAFSIPSTNIEANKYYTKLLPLNLEFLSEIANGEVKKQPYFKRILQLKEQNLKQQIATDITIDVFDLFNKATQKKEINDADSSTIFSDYATLNNKYTQEVEKTNADLKEMNALVLKRISKDAYINIAYKLILKMK